jgi:hypothetical protein
MVHGPIAINQRDRKRVCCPRLHEDGENNRRDHSVDWRISEGIWFNETVRIRRIEPREGRQCQPLHCIKALSSPDSSQLGCRVESKLLDGNTALDDSTRQTRSGGTDFPLAPLSISDRRD